MSREISHHDPDGTAVFGFWVYLMSDVVLFASLFAAYAVLHKATFGGPGPAELFKLPNVLIETMLLLTSSFTCGLALLAAHKGAKEQTVMWLIATLLLGFGFLGLELSEFHSLIAEGHGPSSSAFLSAFFTLVATHGLHIASGSIAMVVLILRTWKKGLTPVTTRRLVTLSLFWHFLDVIWIFIFSIVYLMGVLS